MQTQYAPPNSLKWGGGGAGGGGINYQNQPNFCGKNRSLIRSSRSFWIKTTTTTKKKKKKKNTQLLQSLIIISQAGRDNAVASSSDCRYRDHEFEPTPCHITGVTANHKTNLPSTDSRRAIVRYWRMYRYTCALSLRRSRPV